MTSSASRAASQWMIEVTEESPNGLVTARDGQDVIAEIQSNGQTATEVMANARLIAAAPEMLEALENSAQWLGKMIADGAHLNSVMPNHCVRTLQMVEAAIRKAKGE